MLVKENRVTVVCEVHMGAHLWFGGWWEGKREAMCYRFFLDSSVG